MISAYDLHTHKFFCNSCVGYDNTSLGYSLRCLLCLFMYYAYSCIIVRNLIVKAKEQYIMDKINRCQGDQKSLFNIVNSLLGRGKPTDLPRLQSPAALAEAFKEFFVNKIILIRTLLENMESTMSPLSVDLQSAMCRSANKLEEFTLCSTEEIEKVIRGSSKASCQLDPIPTNILCELPSLLPIITKIVNLSVCWPFPYSAQISNS